MFRRLRGEREKKLAALQSAKAITAWTKKIIVERSNLSHPDRYISQSHIQTCKPWYGGKCTE